ncbi:MAG: hypothetical protein ACE5I2_01580 [Anaerolineae bacterium]
MPLTLDFDTLALLNQWVRCTLQSIITYHLTTTNILPRRPAMMGMTDYHFLVAYNRDNPDDIVGFEILDFSYFIPHLYEPGVVPQLDMCFDVQMSELVIDPEGKVYFKTKDTQLTGVTLQEVLEWAYEEFVLSRVFELRPQLVKAQTLPP